jgi:hypothetical protein
MQIIIKVLIIPACCLFCLGCDINQMTVQVNEERFNYMTVTLNDSNYALTGVYGEAASSLSPPFCIGELSWHKLIVNMAFDDTVIVGSGVRDISHDITYRIQYKSKEAIYKSGVIITERYIHDISTRVKGSFYCKIIIENDTLNFRDGRFDVYLRRSSES